MEDQLAHKYGSTLLFSSCELGEVSSFEDLGSVGLPHVQLSVLAEYE